MNILKKYAEKKWDGIQSFAIPVSKLCSFIYRKCMRKSMPLECTKPPNYLSVLHLANEISFVVYTAKNLHEGILLW